MSDRHCPRCHVPMAKGSYINLIDKPISVLKLDGTLERRTLSIAMCDTCYRETER